MVSNLIYLMVIIKFIIKSRRDKEEINDRTNDFYIWIILYEHETSKWKMEDLIKVTTVSWVSHKEYSPACSFIRGIFEILLRY